MRGPVVPAGPAASAGAAPDGRGQQSRLLRGPAEVQPGAARALPHPHPQHLPGEAAALALPARRLLDASVTPACTAAALKHLDPAAVQGSVSETACFAPVTVSLSGVEPGVVAQVAGGRAAAVDPQV